METVPCKNASDGSGQFRVAPIYQRFYNLCLFRVTRILLVASDYDAYAISEDGQLGARLFSDSSEFYQLSAPRFAHAHTATEALQVLEQRRVDLVLTTLNPHSSEGQSLLSILSKSSAPIPVVLLVLDEVDWRHLVHSRLPEGINWAFFWSGDQRLVTAIVRLIEDEYNAKADTQNAGVQVILAVEDSISSYSLFLCYLYEELMVQSRSLAAEGVNIGHRVLRMMSRPKILLARDYEQAQELFQRYQPYIMALITDVQFDIAGSTSTDAGFRLAQECTEQKPGLPVLMHSSESAYQTRAEKLGYHFSLKNSEHMHAALSNFLSESLGFGDFVFRLPDRTEVGRARDTFEFVRYLQTVNVDSLYYHASHNHFSVWLRARSLFDLADAVRNLNADEIGSNEDLRQLMIGMLQEYTNQESAGLISDSSSKSRRNTSHFLKIGGGSMGGKGRGIGFLHSRLQDLRSELPPGCLALAVPRTVVLGTDVYDSFLQHNGLYVNELVELSDEQIWERLQRCQMPPEMEGDLRAALSEWHGPLIVRSSSLLEDSQHQSCAGLYHTCLVRRNSGSVQRDLQELWRAIFQVYMSTFAQKARSYFANTLFSVEEEKMAIVIQELVGATHGNLFYPQCAGVGVSRNYYPMGPQRREDGVVAMCLGLGHGVVEGGRCVRFSPSWPHVLPHLYDSDGFLSYSQRRFYALDLSAAPEEECLRQFPLSRANEDGTLEAVASVYTENDCWRDGLHDEGAWAVTFSDMLQYSDLNLPLTLQYLLRAFRESLGGVAEFEFAIDMHAQPTLYLLQLRPLTRDGGGCDIGHEYFGDTKIICASIASLGHGKYMDICDIVWVHEDDLDYRAAQLTAGEVAKINRRLCQEDRPYLLIGPGRWGSADPSLGIPVDISQIRGAKVIVELPYGGRSVEPSQGSHFFHELSALSVGYITITERAHYRREKDDDQYQPEHHKYGFFDRGWFERREAEEVGEYVSLIHLERPLRIDLRCDEEPSIIAH